MSEIIVNNPTEAQILEVLAKKHKNDVFVSHCKTGSSVIGSPLILDAWVMPFSWTRPIIGYEIKTSRSDFLRDSKWRLYLKYCHRFYFVTPFEMIYPSEIALEAGLCYLSKSQKIIRSVKQAPTRFWHDIPSQIFMYVLMWRSEELRKISVSG